MRLWGFLLGLSFLGLGMVSCGAEGGAPATPDASVVDAAEGGKLPPPDGGAPLCNLEAPLRYPPAPETADLLAALPDLSFEGEAGSIATASYFEPCAEKSRLFVVRVGAPWCGTCQWHLSHTGELRGLDVGPRLLFLDLVVSGPDNLPPLASDIAAYKASIDAPGDVAIDPAFRLKTLNEGAQFPLPLYALVDTKTMRVVNVLNNPDPDTLAFRVRQELALLDRVVAPKPSPPQTFDGRFTRDQWDLVHAMTPLPALPKDPTNAVADDPGAALLGEKFFSDTRLAESGVTCASCHAPLQHFADGEPQSTAGLSRLDRNSPGLLLAAYSPWQFWDGRADSLWMQALGPFEDAKEVGSSRLHVLHQVYTHHRAHYEVVFGPMPDLSDTNRFPLKGKPGDAAYDQMSATDKDLILRAYSNVGKAIAAFERTLRVKPNKLDAYAAGDLNALSEEEKHGLHSFFMAGCAQCHFGPRLTNDSFHAVRFPTGRQDGAADRGRVDAIAKLLSSDFRSTGPYSDSTVDTHRFARLSENQLSMLGAFRTPSLRGSANTAPYGHGGTVATFEELSKIYSTAGLEKNDPRATGASEPWLPRFDEPTRDSIPAFLKVLVAEPDP